MKCSRFTAVAASIGLTMAYMNAANSAIVGTSLTFTATELDAFTVQSSDPGYVINDLGLDSPTNAVTLAPAYSDNTTPLTGSAGATGSWPTAAFGSDTSVFLGASFAAMNLSGLGLTDLREIAFNDNDDTWGHSVWIDTTDDNTFNPVSSVVHSINGSTAGPPTSALLSQDISGLDLSTVVAWGVSIHGDLQGGDFPSSADAFHSSFSAVPIPAAVWLFGSALIGMFGIARRNKLLAD